MNIGIVTTWFERGGAYVSKQYVDVLKKEHDVFIYARGGEGYAIGNPEWDSEVVTWGKKIPIGMPMSIDLADFKKWILNNHLDTVFFNEQQWWPPVLLANQLGVKTGAYVDYYTKETVPLFANYDFLICNTKRHLSAFSWHNGAKYVPWGTDINLFAPQQFEPITDGIVTFFHSCGVSPERKGTDLLLIAFKRMNNQAQLVIHIQTKIKEHFPDLSAIIDTLVNDGKLTIIERTVGAPGLYHLGDVYVYPSRLEGIGLTMAEALACGLPLITSDNPPMNEFVSDCNGKLVKIDKTYNRDDGYFWPQCEVNTEDLTKKMESYVNQLYNLESLKKQARKYAEEHLDWNKNKLQIVEIFNQSTKISNQKKITVVNKTIEYESNRSTWRTRVYASFPFFFKPFSWLWFLIRYKYIQS